MDWETNTQEKCKLFTSKIPVFHRHIAEGAVIKMAEESARKRGCAQVEEEDVVSAFFCGVPSPFYSMMVRLLEQTGFDYRRYGFPRYKI